MRKLIPVLLVLALIAACKNESNSGVAGLASGSADARAAQNMSAVSRSAGMRRLTDARICSPSRQTRESLTYPPTDSAADVILSSVAAVSSTVIAIFALRTIIFGKPVDGACGGGGGGGGAA